MQRSRAVSPALKASFHELTGSGKRRTRRPFFGLTETDAKDVERRITDAIERAIR